MKTKLLALCTMFLLFPAYGQEAHELRSAADHLRAVNKLWQDYPQYLPSESVSFENENARIEYHLLHVIAMLRSSGSAQLTNEQKVERTLLLNALEEYAKARVFPLNIYHSERRPYFVDHLGTHCAVGYLMHVSGNDALVSQIVKEHNYDYVKDIRTPGVLDWARTKGFQASELALIQPGYPPSSTMNAVQNGANGPVRKLKPDPWTMSMVVAGDFTELNQMPCLNIGYYANEQLSCYGNGLEGIVNDFFTTQDYLYACGSFPNGGEIYPLARFDGVNWNYISVPGRTNATSTAVFDGLSGYELELALQPDGQSGLQELWLLNTSGAWEKKAEVDGEILVIAGDYGSRFYGGHFAAVQTFQGGIPDTLIATNNLVAHFNVGPEWGGVGSEISDTVKTIVLAGTVAYIGGSCAINTPNSVYLSRWQNGTVQAILTGVWFENTAEPIINTLLFDNDQALYIGGKFDLSQMVGTYGNNLARLDLMFFGMEAVAAGLNGPVDGLSYYQGKIYAGGEFTANLNASNLNHLAYLDNVAGLDQMQEDNEIQLSPVPFLDQLHVVGVESGEFILHDMRGARLLEGNFFNATISGLEVLPKGAYLLTLRSENRIWSRKVMK